MAKKTKKTEEITKKFGDERRKALDDALKNIEKDFGKMGTEKENITLLVCLTVSVFSVFYFL